MKSLAVSLLIISLALVQPLHGQDQKNTQNQKNKKVPPPSSLDTYLAQARQMNLPAKGTNGSLFSASNPSLYMFRDPKARTSNDIVTIQIAENASATNSSNTSTSRTSDAGLAAPGLFGAEKSTSMDFTKLLQANTALNFAGQGATTSNGTLNAWLTAQVVEVLPNGNMVIQGTKDVTVNKEKQTLTIRGVIRAADIGPTNIVQSTSIANMEVSFGGKGMVSTANHPGFLYWLFSKIIPL